MSFMRYFNLCIFHSWEILDYYSEVFKRVHQLSATDILDISNASDLSGMFMDVTSLMTI